MLLTVIFTFALSALCFAADGDALNKQQATAEVFVNVFTENAPAYTSFTAGFDDSLKSKINRQAYLTLQQQVKERFGTVKEVNFILISVLMNVICNLYCCIYERKNW